MTERRAAAVVLLCEDKQQESFFRRLLKQEGYQRIRVRPYAPGKGAATQHVSERFPAEAAAQRRRSSHMRCGLVTAIDADTRSVEQRYGDVWDQIAPQRGEDEPIALFIPKRNIETWVHYLNGRADVNEEERYPRFTGRESECHPAVERFRGIARGGTPPPDCLPSLRRACDEYHRLP